MSHSYVYNAYDGGVQQNRYLLQTACAQRMITQKFPPYLSRFRFNKDILAKATPRQLRMLGNHERGNFD